MLKRIVVLFVLMSAIGAGSLTTRSASAAPQASKLWAGEPTEPDDYGEPDEPSVRLSETKGPSQPGDGLVWALLIRMLLR